MALPPSGPRRLIVSLRMVIRKIRKEGRKESKQATKKERKTRERIPKISESIVSNKSLSKGLRCLRTDMIEPQTE
jgi:hypothetical protein